ncbi:MAG: hypothetical protein ACOH2M_14275 [Cypionkella sp.]
MTLRSSALIVDVETIGAELQSLKDESGWQFLWQGDAMHWPQRAPILFPVIGLPRDGMAWFDGVAHRMERHGFAQTLNFDVVQQSDVSASLSAGSNALTRQSYPYQFGLVVDFKLDCARLTVAATVLNEERERTMPFCFGFHPGFAWPLPGRPDKSAHAINVASVGPAKQRRLNGSSLLSNEHVDFESGRDLQLDEGLFASGAVILEDVRPAEILYRAEKGPSIHISTENLPHLGIWSRGQGQYLCIEPWSAVPQAEDYFGNLAAMPYATSLPPGGRATYAMTISVQAGAATT